jgi:hypothetical protein
MNANRKTQSELADADHIGSRQAPGRREELIRRPGWRRGRRMRRDVSLDDDESQAAEQRSQEPQPGDDPGFARRLEAGSAMLSDEDDLTDDEL